MTHPFGSGHDVDPVIKLMSMKEKLRLVTERYDALLETEDKLLNIIVGYERLIKGIQAALETEETDSNLIEVARDACHAERKLAALERKLQNKVAEIEIETEDQLADEYLANKAREDMDLKEKQIRSQKVISLQELKELWDS